MTETARPRARSSDGFYDSLAQVYDDMTRFGQRFDRERPWFHALVRRYGIHTAIDAGCGTGFHALLLSQLGVQVTAVDSSPAMIETLRTHAARMNLPVQATQGTLQHLPDVVHGAFDSVFCLGNTLPHLMTEDDLDQTFTGFSTLMHPGGHVFLQLLNYHRILDKRPRVLASSETPIGTFVRFYDYREETIVFNVLRVFREENVRRHELIRTTLRPWLDTEIVSSLARSGFTEIELFGNATLQTFDAEASQDVFIIARAR